MFASRWFGALRRCWLAGCGGWFAGCGGCLLVDDVDQIAYQVGINNFAKSGSEIIVGIEIAVEIGNRTNTGMFFI